ncbi:MAG: cytochrome c biogenesis protein CcdA [Acidobacteriota bacterium]
MTRRILALLGLLALAFGRPVSAQTPGVLQTAEALVEQSSVRPGDSLRAALKVPIPDNLHVQSHTPRDPSLIGVRLTISPPPGVSVQELVYPPSTDYPLAGFAQPLSVYEKELLIGIQLVVDKGATPGKLTIPGELRYQACDDKLCYYPRTMKVQWDVMVAPARRGQTTAQHRDLFARIAFGKGEAPGAPVPVAAQAPAPVAAESATTPEQVVALFDQFAILGTGGYMSSAEFVDFLHNAENGVKTKGMFEDKGPIAILALVFIGGLALNLTPCVLPMIPINLAIIGAGAKSGKRGRGFLLGLAYGAAMAAVYGVLGLVVILTAGTFGTINASPWFNVGIAALFVVLGLAMFDIINIDFSRLSSRIQFKQESRGTVLLALGMGAIAALLAGACVAPVVIQVVVFSSDMYATGTRSALALPFVLGLGMALPWPLAGAGLSALPKPGMWMVRVKQAMGVFIIGMATYYGYLAYEGFSNRWVDPASVSAGVEEKLREGWHASLAEGLQAAKQNRSLVLVDFWATWCKNCFVMDRTTLADPAVTAALAGYTKIKFQAENPDTPPARDLMQRIRAAGLPAYVVLRPR